MSTGRRADVFRVVVAMIALMLVVAVPGRVAFAQAPAPSTREPKARPGASAEDRREKRALSDRAAAAFTARDWPRAEAALRLLLERWPNEFAGWYNLASVLAQRGQVAEAERALERAVVEGFVDFRQLERDANLSALREGDTYRALIKGWRALQDAHAEASVRAYAQTLGPGYIVRRDEQRRLAFVSGFPEVSLSRVRGELASLTRWWERRVLPEGERADSADPERPDPWVVVVLLNARDFRTWSEHNFGPVAARAGSVAGVYDHDKKELVSMDLGATLRHEFLHVLHWRHMSRSGFVQPLWVQEGLCSLGERVEPVAPDAPAATAAPDARDGAGHDNQTSLAPAPSWRVNLLRRAQASGTLTPWSALMRDDPDAFVERRVLANYAQAYGVMLHLLERDQLRAWYADLVANHAQDPSGVRAIERATGRSLKEAEASWRGWIKALAPVPDQHTPLPVELPFEVEPAGDGLRVRGPVRGVAFESGLREGDVLTDVAGRPTRDLNELALALAQRRAGDDLPVAFRRASTLGTAKVRLRATE